MNCLDRRGRLAVALLLLGCLVPAITRADEASGIRPLRKEMAAALAAFPAHTHRLLDPQSIEQFLVELEGAPPDWATVYGQGHDDPGHDERLFALNRERDAKREGKAPLQWLIAFVWLGELSGFDEQEGGFHVVLGPKFNQTGWGEVRFKYEDLPSPLIALAGEDTAGLKVQARQGRPVPVSVLMLGRLIPEESLIYDFSHEVEGQGMIMPVVRVEAVEFVSEVEEKRRP